MGKELSSGVAEIEQHLQLLSVEWTAPRERECLLCYVYRMLEFGCNGLTFAQRFRDLRAPRATGLERRLGASGGFCDCEIFMNAVAPHPSILVPPPEPDPDGRVLDDEFTWPDPFPACRGVRAGSTRNCTWWTWRARW